MIKKNCALPFVFLLALVPGSLFAQEMMNSFNPSSKTTMTYRGFVAPGSPIKMHQHRLGLSHPVYKDETDTWAVSLRAEDLRLDPQPVLSTGTVVPRDLSTFELGFGFHRKLPEQKSIAARVTVGSSGDRPLIDSRETTLSMMAFYTVPSDEQASWIYVLFMSNNSPIGNYIPIPGVAYMYRSPTLMGLFGFPFSFVNWTFAEKWMTSASLLGPAVNFELIHGERFGPQAFIGYSWTHQTFLRRERTEERDRLYFEDEKIFLGARSPLSKSLSAEAQLGLTFDRSVYEGEKLLKPVKGSAELGESWFTSINLKYEI